jgi:hypothetical protein
LVRACGNCHSNHTDWPWYSHVAPVSWWITQHVREGREKLDFSDWERYSAWQKRDKHGFHVRTHIDGQDAAMAVHHNACRGETYGRR